MGWRCFGRNGEELVPGLVGQETKKPHPAILAGWGRHGSDITHRLPKRHTLPLGSDVKQVETFPTPIESRFIHLDLVIQHVLHRLGIPD